MCFVRVIVMCVTLALAGWNAVLAQSARPSALAADPSATADRSVTQLIDDTLCPCQCGNFLPGSSRSPACFGCSVGKAMVSRILEASAKGRPLSEILLNSTDPVLVDIFADYTDPRLQKIWQDATRAAEESGGTVVVVVRTPAHTPASRRVLQLLDCARASGRFDAVHTALIHHRGDFGRETLIRLGAKQGLDTQALESCMARPDSLDTQIEKDRQHAEERGLRLFPAVTVDRRPVPADYSSIRRAIQKALLAKTL